MCSERQLEVVQLCFREQNPKKTRFQPLIFLCHISVCKKITAQIGDIVASFLPGVSMAMCTIATGDSKQGYAVTVVSTAVL